MAKTNNRSKQSDNPDESKQLDIFDLLEQVESEAVEEVDSETDLEPETVEEVDFETDLEPETVEEVDFETDLEPETVEEVDSETDLEPEADSPNRGKPILVALELEDDQKTSDDTTNLELPDLPSRWESARDAAENKNVLPALLKQIRRVQALNYLEYLINLSRDEGYVWVVYGASGSGKSAFFQTLEYQTNGEISVEIINGNNAKVKYGNKTEEMILAHQSSFAKYLDVVINKHKEKKGELAPLVVVLEERENEMSTDERSSITQALKNILRPPNPGKNVVFVLPVTNSTVGDLFLKQAVDTGVATPLGHNAIYTFQGPSYREHVDILESLFRALNSQDISHYGLQRKDLQKHVSSQQTIGQYIRVVKEELYQGLDRFNKTIKSYNYRPLTVIMCFVNPLAVYVTQPTVKGMTMDAYGRINRGEILRVTQSQLARRWQTKRQVLANIVESLDIRVVELPPEIIVKAFYAYGWEKPENAQDMIKQHLQEKNINYNTPKSVRQNLRQQLKATNLFRIIAGEETQRIARPKKKNPREDAEIEITRLACSKSKSRQVQLHKMIAEALDDLLQNPGGFPSLSDFKGVYSEAWLTLNSDKVI